MKLLLLLLLLGDPFDFVQKPKVEPLAPVVETVEVKEEPFVGPVDDVKARIQQLEDEHKQHVAQVEEEYQNKLTELKNAVEKAHIKIENLAGMRSELITGRGAYEDKIMALEKENTQLRSGVKNLLHQYASLESKVASVPQIEMTDFSQLQREHVLPVQMVITTSPSCSACVPFCNNLSAKLRPHGYVIGEDVDSPIRIKRITDAEWKRLGYTLPHVEIITRGQSQAISERDPFKLGHLLNAAVLTERAMPPLPGEQLAGLAVATVAGKQQVIQMLSMLEPFLDGGTLQIIYTAKPGVVKNFLTIKQGPVGIKIPPKTTFELSMKAGDLTVRMIDPKPEVLLGPIDRGIQEIDITPNKISLRLPWMIDPELRLK